MKKFFSIFFVLIVLFSLSSCFVGEEKVYYEINYYSEYGNTPDSITAKRGELIPEPSLEMITEGYQFIGWYSNESLSDEIQWPLFLNGHYNLYAKWAEIFSVTFNYGYDDLQEVLTSIKYSEEIIEPTEPKRDGFVFTGWYYEGSNTRVNWPIRFSSNHSLIAKWRPDKVEIKLEDDTFYFENYAKLEIEIIIKDESFKTNGNFFEIPLKYQDGYVKDITIRANNISTNFLYNKKTKQSMNSPFDIIIVDNNIKWSWIGNDYRSKGFALYLNGKLISNNYAPQYNLTTLLTETKTSQTFVFEIYAKANEPYTDSEIVRFEYEYEVLDYDIDLVYNYNNKVEKISTEKGYLSLPTPIRDGYQFNGWYLSNDSGSNLTTRWYEDYKVLESFTLYASWVEYQSGGGREVLRTPQVSVNGDSFSWDAISRAESYSYRIHIDGYTDTYWYTTNFTGIDIPYYANNNVTIDIKANGDGNRTVDSNIVSRTWYKSSYNIIGNVELNYDIGIWYWKSDLSSFDIELIEKGTNKNYLSTSTTLPEVKIPENLPHGEYYLSINGRRISVRYQMLNIAENIKIDKLGNNYRLKWDNVKSAENYEININDQTFNSNVNYLDIESYLLDKSILNVTIKAMTGSTDIFNSFLSRKQFILLDKFNLNGGLFEDFYLESMEYPVPTKEGYTFLGWYLDKDFSIPINDVNEMFNTNFKYAKWIKGDLRFNIVNDFYELVYMNSDEIDVELPKEYLGVPVKGIGEFAIKYSSKNENLTISKEYIYISGPIFDNNSGLFDLLILVKFESKPTSWDLEWNNMDLDVIWNFNGFKVTYYNELDEIILVKEVGMGIILKTELIPPVPNNYYFREWDINILGKRIIRDYELRPIISLIDRDFSYVEDSDGITITGYIGDRINKLIIPDLINNKPVTKIGPSAFYRKNFKYIQIPDTVTDILNNAFKESSLVEIKLPNELKEIGSEAFNQSQLETIIFNDKLKVIGDFAFANNYLKNLEIPASVEIIGDYAFYNSKINKLDFREGLKEVGNYAFASNLISKVIIPKTVNKIQDYAFRDNDIELTLEMSSLIDEVGSFILFGSVRGKIFVNFDKNDIPLKWNSYWNAYSGSYNRYISVYYKGEWKINSDLEYEIITK